MKQEKEGLRCVFLVFPDYVYRKHVPIINQRRPSFGCIINLFVIASLIIL